MLTDNKYCFGSVLNIGTGGQYSIQELFDILKEKLAFEKNPIYGTLRPGDIPHSNADILKAQVLLEYNPTVSFREGIERTVEYFLQ